MKTGAPCAINRTEGCLVLETWAKRGFRPVERGPGVLDCRSCAGNEVDFPGEEQVVWVVLQKTERGSQANQVNVSIGAEIAFGP